jgi:hypothetical protein
VYWGVVIGFCNGFHILLQNNRCFRNFLRTVFQSYENKSLKPLSLILYENDFFTSLKLGVVVGPKCCSDGHSGGIWILKNYVATITTIVIDSNQYSITFTLTPGDAASTCTCVYPNPTLRTNFWNYHIDFGLIIIGPWLLIGDFNETILHNDQQGGIFQHTRATLFR